MACELLDLGCYGEQWAESAIGDAVENMANAVLEAFGKAIASLGTLWVNVGTPNLTGTGGSSPIAAGSSAPDAGNITTVLGYVTWISFAVAAVSLVILGGLIATRLRRGEGFAAVGRVGIILAGVILIGGAAGLVSTLLPNGPSGAGGAVLFLQSALWWYMGAAAVASIIIGGARMAWEQRAEPGRETLRSLLTLIVVAGAGVTIVGLLVTAADSFSVWIINGSLTCDVLDDGACFGENMQTLLGLTTNPAVSSLGSLLIIILGLIAILATAFQIVLMVARGGMLVILTGILPLAASATNTEMGKTWFKKCIAWLVAFILYKPAAAIVYAAAFQLVGTDVFQDDGSGLLAILTGLMLMLIALFAMPALMRFVTPMVGALTAGAGASGAALAVGGLAALPTGAAALGRMGSGSGGGNSAAPPAGANGNPGNPGSAGNAGPSGNSGGGGPSGGNPGGGTSAPGAAQTAAGQQVAGSTGAGASSGAAAAQGSSAAAGGAAAAGAAGGPIGVAAGAALEAGKATGQAAAGAARSMGEQSTGEGGGPDGNR